MHSAILDIHIIHRRVCVTSQHCKTILYFEGRVSGHFRNKSDHIFTPCRN